MIYTNMHSVVVSYNSVFLLKLLNVRKYHDH